MLKKLEIRRAKTPFEVEEKVQQERLVGYETHSPLIKEYLNVEFKVLVSYLVQNDEMSVVGMINYQLKAIDARDGNEIIHEESIPWNDVYSFDEATLEEMNVILGEDVDLLQLAIGQINANIPLNLSHNHGIISKTGFGWSLMSEDEYQEQKDHQPDPRWEMLKDFNFKKEKDK